MAKRVLLVLWILLTCLTAALVAFAVAPGPAAGATSAYLRSPAVTLAVGGTHTLALRANGRIQAWGSNLYGQLGDGTTTQRTSPTWAGSDTDWVAVACGANHSVALKANGTLYAWGQNIDGQLGLNDLTFVRLPPGWARRADWVAVACGAMHTVALKADGILWVWGDNSYGQLGLNDTTDRMVPTRSAAPTGRSSPAAARTRWPSSRTDGCTRGAATTTGSSVTAPGWNGTTRSAWATRRTGWRSPRATIIAPAFVPTAPFTHGAAITTGSSAWATRRT